VSDLKEAFIKTFLDVDKADTQKQRTVGLQNKENLGDHEALLLDFDTHWYHSIWMKDTSIPLDIVFLSEGEVVAIREGVPNSTEKMTHYCDKVLELNRGKASDLGISEGEDLSEVIEDV
jgi:uncharacterized membrane protein (UPF0127 family)